MLGWCGLIPPPNFTMGWAGYHCLHITMHRLICNGAIHTTTSTSATATLVHVHSHLCIAHTQCCARLACRLDPRMPAAQCVRFEPPHPTPHLQISTTRTRDGRKVGRAPIQTGRVNLLIRRGSLQSRTCAWYMHEQYSTARTFWPSARCSGIPSGRYCTVRDDL